MKVVLAYIPKQGDVISKSEPVRHSYYRTFQKDPGSQISVKIYQCEDERAPHRRIPSVTHLCTINCEVNMPFSSWPAMKSKSGERYRTLDYEVEMVPSGASVEFTVYIDGKKQGSENAAIKFM